jgi:hypothetical protein
MSTNQFLTVNLILTAGGNGGKESAGFTSLLFDLTALALERFDVATKGSPSCMAGKLAPASLVGFPANPFEGSTFSFPIAHGLNPLHSTKSDHTKDPGGRIETHFAVKEVSTSGVGQRNATPKCDAHPACRTYPLLNSVIIAPNLAE